jgi:hypothetical protein
MVAAQSTYSFWLDLGANAKETKNLTTDKHGSNGSEQSLASLIPSFTIELSAGVN